MTQLQIINAIEIVRTAANQLQMANGHEDFTAARLDALAEILMSELEEYEV